jgi:hypothetical protein
MKAPLIMAAVVGALALSACQTNPQVAAFLGTGDRCQQAENAYAAFRIVAGNKSTKQVEAFMAGVRAARDAGSNCETFNLAQLAQAIASGKAVLGVK